MGGGGAKIPEPAQRPERILDVEPEDIQLGNDTSEEEKLKLKGKRSLIKPSGATDTSGLKV